ENPYTERPVLSNPIPRPARVSRLRHVHPSLPLPQGGKFVRCQGLQVLEQFARPGVSGRSVVTVEPHHLAPLGAPGDHHPGGELVSPAPATDAALVDNFLAPPRRVIPEIIPQFVVTGWIWPVLRLRVLLQVGPRVIEVHEF